ncbi:hypothetical protein MKW98_010928 [Papaver atlanticum]|uniref:Pectinesterase n=1 Tax=Papaver atlanticum TaxID=357466 RepID=A0AAD4SMC4_9MAGN|nr:hypothetical protein MKW98_010928 [Papaver atlanticum]
MAKSKKKISSNFGVLGVFFFVLFVTCELSSASSVKDQNLHGQKNFITWNDCTLNLMERSFLEDNGTRKNSMGLDVIVVAKDGTGDSETLQGAINTGPVDNTRRVLIPEKKPYISLIGIEPNTTVITWNAKASDKDEHGKEIRTFKSQSNHMQAVALKISGDKAVFYNVRFLGYQDTLYGHHGTHYFYKCFIQGAIDFVFGNARRHGYGFIAASHRNSPDENTGFSFLNSRIRGRGKNFLGRPWGKYSRAIYIKTDMDKIISPEGWNDWKDPSKRSTVTFGEFQCSGEGSNTQQRVQWSKLFTQEEIQPFQGKHYIDGQEWLGI